MSRLQGFDVHVDFVYAPGADCDGDCPFADEVDGQGAVEYGAEAIGDGSLLKLFLEYLPQIIELLVKLGVLKPKGEFDAQKFGDGEFLKKLIPLLKLLLPILLGLLKDEEPSGITDEP